MNTGYRIYRMICILSILKKILHTEISEQVNIALSDNGLMMLLTIENIINVFFMDDGTLCRTGSPIMNLCHVRPM